MLVAISWHDSTSAHRAVVLRLNVSIAVLLCSMCASKFALRSWMVRDPSELAMLTFVGRATVELAWLPVVDASGGADAPGGRAPDGAGLATACAGEGPAVPIIICEKFWAYPLMVSGAEVAFALCAGRPGLVLEGAKGKDDNGGPGCVDTTAAGFAVNHSPAL